MKKMRGKKAVTCTNDKKSNYLVFLWHKRLSTCVNYYLSSYHLKINTFHFEHTVFMFKK